MILVKLIIENNLGMLILLFNFFLEEGSVIDNLYVFFNFFFC